MNKLIFGLFISMLLLSCRNGKNTNHSVQSMKRNAKARSTVKLGQPVDSIAVLKGAREMHVFSKNNLIKVYIISLGKGMGKKQFEGDHKTPEGLYFINARNDASIYHKNLSVSYPNAADWQYAQSKGKSPGSEY